MKRAAIVLALLGLLAVPTQAGHAFEVTGWTVAGDTVFGSWLELDTQQGPGVENYTLTCGSSVMAACKSLAQHAARGVSFLLTARGPIVKQSASGSGVLTQSVRLRAESIQAP